MTRTARRLLVCGAAIVGLHACLPTQPCACPPTRSHAVVTGRVVTTGGEPVSGARVRAVVFRTICGREPGESDPGSSALTAVDGTYSVALISAGGPGPSCVRVTAAGPLSDSDSVEVYAALLLTSEREEPGRAVVDLVLGPRPTGDSSGATEARVIRSR